MRNFFHFSGTNFFVFKIIAHAIDKQTPNVTKYSGSFLKNDKATK